MEEQLPGNVKRPPGNVPAGQASFKLVFEVKAFNILNEVFPSYCSFILSINLHGFWLRSHQLEAGLATLKMASSGSCPTMQSVQIEISSILICLSAFTR